MFFDDEKKYFSENFSIFSIFQDFQDFSDFFRIIFFHHQKVFFSEKISFFHKLYGSGYYHPKYDQITPNSREVLSDQKKYPVVFFLHNHAFWAREFRIHTTVVSRHVRFVQASVVAEASPTGSWSMTRISGSVLYFSKNNRRNALLSGKLRPRLEGGVPP